MKKGLLFFVFIILSIVSIYTSFFNSSQLSFSTIENRNLVTRDDIKGLSCVDGSLQNKVENLVQDQLPLKTFFLKVKFVIEHKKSDILNNLSHDNHLIKEGNYYRISGTDYYTNAPLECSEEQMTLYNNRIYNYQQIAEKIGDKYEVYIYKTTMSEEKNWFDNEYFHSDGEMLWEDFYNALSSNYHCAEQQINTLDDYFKYRYKTDHHWNEAGAYQGYRDIISMMCQNVDIDEPYDIDYIEEFNYPFYGSLSLKCMNILGSDVFKVVHLKDDSNFDIQIIDGFEENLGVYGLDEFDISNMSYVYENYYGENNREIIVTNNSKPDAPSLLMLVDSNSNIINLDIARHFSKTYIIDTRSWKDENDPFNSSFRLIGYLDEHQDIDVLLWLQCYQNLYFDSTSYLHLGD